MTLKTWIKRIRKAFYYKIFLRDYLEDTQENVYEFAQKFIKSIDFYLKFCYNNFVDRFVLYQAVTLNYKWI